MYVFLSLISLAAVIYVLVTYVPKIGSQKSQKIELTNKNDFVFDINDGNSFITVAYFYLREIIPKV